MKEVENKKIAEHIYASYWKSVGRGYEVFIIDEYKPGDPFYLKYKRYTTLKACERYVDKWTKGQGRS